MVSRLKFPGYFFVFFMMTLFIETYPQYSISSFQTGVRTVPPSGNNIIQPIEGTTLKQVEKIPNLKPGEILLRRRFSANNYGLFIGRINQAAYDKISAFRLQTPNLEEAVTLKYYLQESINPDNDWPNIYFDNDMIYAENADRLLCHNSAWETLAKIDKQPCRLSIASDPPGATVIIDGVEKGTTPDYVGAVFASSIVVQIKKEGYYMEEECIDLEGKTQVDKKFILPRKIVLQNDTAINLEAYTAENTESADELDQRIAGLNDRIKKIKQENANALAKFDKNYPPLSPKGEFEKTKSFEDRAQSYGELRVAERDRIVAEGGLKIEPLVRAAGIIKKYKQTLEDKVYEKSFPGNGLLLGTYNADSEFFPVSDTIREGDFEISFMGKLPIPVDIAPEVKKRVGEAEVLLSYNNSKDDFLKNGVRVKRYYRFSGLKIKVLDKKYDCTGDILLLDCIPTLGYFSGRTLVCESYENIGKIPAKSAKRFAKAHLLQFELLIQKVDASKMTFSGQMAFTKGLSGINGVEGSLTQTGITFKETNHIKKGMAMTLGDIYNLEFKGMNNTDGSWVTTTGRKGLLKIINTYRNDSDSMENGYSADNDKSDSNVSNNAPTSEYYAGRTMVGTAGRFLVVNAGSSSGYPFELKIDEYDTSSKAFKGKIIWNGGTECSGTNRVEGNILSNGLTFKETGYIEKGTAIIGPVYTLSYKGSGVLDGSWLNKSNRHKGWIKIEK